MAAAEKKRYLTNHDQGMAAVLVLIFTGALFMLGGALLGYAVNEKIIAGYQAQDAALYYITEAGLETGITALQQDFLFSGELVGTLAGGSFRVTFENADIGRRRISSHGTLDNNRKTRSVMIENNPVSGIIVTEWIKP
ncbi:MAG TPA: hypothetical protein VLH18_03015 [Candidatus Limnocylindrales bacterium]|nr:hypothetical protein [Candidatus Limnocylindrales bacterium]